MEFLKVGKRFVVEIPESMQVEEINHHLKPLGLKLFYQSGPGDYREPVSAKRCPVCGIINHSGYTCSECSNYEGSI